MSLLSVGTVAFDTIITPTARAERVIGGAGSYSAWAASFFSTPVNLVSIVGDDFPVSEINEMESRGIETEGIDRVLGKKSFFWEGEYLADFNSRETHKTELNVLADFDPQLPDFYKDSEYLLLANLTPAIQKSVIQQMNQRPKLIVLDTMNFWMDVAWDELMEVIGMCDVLTINDEEARQLSGVHSLANAATKILQMGPKYLIIKKGEHGALLFAEDGIFSCPAIPLQKITDPTGAGDCFAGGFLGYIASQGDTSYKTLKKAIAYGSVVASFCVEEFSLDRLKSLQKEEVEKRYDLLIDMMSI